MSKILHLSILAAPLTYLSSYPAILHTLSLIVNETTSPLGDLRE